MKKILHILIAVIFIYNILGYFAVFQILKYKAKKEIKAAIKAKLPASALTIIAVSAKNKSEIKWFKEGKEFMYHDMMFDVVKKEQKGDITYYHCINDIQEKELFANLNDHIEKHIKNDLSTNKKTKSILKKVVNLYFSIAKFTFNENESVQITYSNISEYVKSITVEIPVPPPKKV